MGGVTPDSSGVREDDPFIPVRHSPLMDGQGRQRIFTHLILIFPVAALTHLPTDKRLNRVRSGGDPIALGWFSDASPSDKKILTSKRGDPLIATTNI